MTHIKCIQTLSNNNDVVFYKGIVYSILDKKGELIKVTTSIYKTTTMLDMSAEYFNEHFEVV